VAVAAAAAAVGTKPVNARAAEADSGMLGVTGGWCSGAGDAGDAFTRDAEMCNGPSLTVDECMY
jgi:hypothetical protein